MGRRSLVMPIRSSWRCSETPPRLPGPWGRGSLIRRAPGFWLSWTAFSPKDVRSFPTVVPRRWKPRSSSCSPCARGESACWLCGSFHGRTLGALGLTFNPKYRKPWQDQLCAVEHRTPEALLEAVGDDVAAVFVEPIQGEGGVYLLDPAFGAALSVRCRQTGTLLVADEIQCGWGRCGAVLASVEAGISPDVVCLAKGVAGGFPVGVTVWRGVLGDFPPRGHGSTYGGNPLACALGVATWELLHRENLFRWARETGRMFREQLAALDAPGVTEVRGQGLLVGVEIDGDAEVVVRELQRRGVLALPAGPRVVRFLPPFGASPESFSRVAEVLGEALREVPRGR